MMRYSTQLFHLALSCLFFCSAFLAKAQLTVNNATNATTAVQTYLLGDGIEATNITFAGDANQDQIASFTCTGCNLNIASGVVLSSGNASTASGPNSAGGSSTSYGTTSSDPDLNAISAVSINDAAILQFDFIPTGDSLVFNYVFGSDEYPEYTNNIFNDAFGFFLSGPGINGPYQNNAINIAQIPGTSLPVSINNLNNGSTGTNGPCEYCQYYIHNGTGSQAPYNGSNTYIQCDGFTTVLQAYAQVQCGETYHIKIAIADGGDGSFNSWVFLEEGSFESNSLDLSFNQPGLSPTENSMYEGCEGQSILFTRPAGAVGDLSFNVTYSGTAVNGEDYYTLPATIELPDGVDTVEVPISAMSDDVTEGMETLILTVDAGIACANSISLELEIYDLAPLLFLMGDITVACGEDAVFNPALIGGYGEYVVTWEGLGEGFPFTTTITENTTVNYTVSDGCEVEDVSGSFNVIMQQYPELTVDLGNDLVVNCQEEASITPAVSGGNSVYTYSWMIDDTEVSTSSVLLLPDPGDGPVTIEVTDGCGTSATDVVNIDLQSPAVIVDLGQDIATSCFSEVTIDADISGGIGTYVYSWEVNGVFAGNGSTVTTIADNNSSVVLSVTDECGGVGTDEVGFDIPSEPIVVSIGDDLGLTCIDIAYFLPVISGGTGNYEYTWTVNGVISGQDATFSLPAFDEATVALAVNDECGASGSDAIVISLISTPLSIAVQPSYTVTCLSPLTVTPTLTGGVGGTEFLWTYDGSSSSAATLTIYPDEEGVITLTATDDCGNSDTETIEIELAESNLAVNITAGDSDVCPGEPVLLTASVSGAIGSPSYDWSVPGSGANVTVSAGQTTTYTITVTDDCDYSATDSYEMDVLEEDGPLSTGTVEVCHGVFSTDVASGGFAPYEYFYASDSLEYAEGDFTAIYDGEYEITVIDHCDNVSSFTLISRPCEIVVPNVFTPNGDAENQTFKVDGISGFPGSTLIVFNRWGKEVYSHASYNNNWNGGDLAEGTYFYVLKRVDGQEFSGTITLLR